MLNNHILKYFIWREPKKKSITIYFLSIKNKINHHIQSSSKIKLDKISLKLSPVLTITPSSPMSQQPIKKVQRGSSREITIENGEIIIWLNYGMPGIWPSIRHLKCPSKQVFCSYGRTDSTFWQQTKGIWDFISSMRIKKWWLVKGNNAV